MHATCSGSAFRQAQGAVSMCWLWQQSVHEPATQPHAQERQPGGQREDRSAGHARAHGATARQYAAKTHGNGANDVAHHGQAVVKSFDFELALDQSAQGRAHENGRQHASIEVKRRARGSQHTHQPLRRRAAEGQSGHGHRVEAGLRNGIGEVPRQSHRQAGTHAANPHPGRIARA